jgi:hypothetical protein
MKKSLRFLAAALLGGGCWVACVHGQDFKQRFVGRPDAAAPVPINDGVDGARPRGYVVFDFDERQAFQQAVQERQAFQQAVQKLRSVKEGPEKEAVKKELSALLDKSFTRDLEHREQEVAEIEVRVKKLKDQIERRKKAKDEIVGLRLKTIVNETEGLGFSDPQDLAPAPGKYREAPHPTYDAFVPRPGKAPVPDRPQPDGFLPRSSPVPDGR